MGVNILITLRNQPQTLMTQPQGLGKYLTLEETSRKDNGQYKSQLEGKNKHINYLCNINYNN